MDLLTFLQQHQVQPMIAVDLQMEQLKAAKEPPQFAFDFTDLPHQDGLVLLLQGVQSHLSRQELFQRQMEKRQELLDICEQEHNPQLLHQEEKRLSEFQQVMDQSLHVNEHANDALDADQSSSNETKLPTDA